MTKPSRRPRVAHVAAYDRNVGDNALNHAIDRMVGKWADVTPIELVANPFDAETHRHLNSFDAIIFGGGGVIHSCSSNDRHKNRERTGTMWNMPLEDVATLQPPMVLYGVGYNRFQGEPEPLPVMVEFFDVLRRRGDLIRFRNDGSVARLEHDLPALAGRFHEVPDPGLFCRGPRRRDGDYLLLQIATDRPDYRFPAGIGAFVALVNQLLEASPYPTILIPHTKSDGAWYQRIGSELRVDRVLDLKLGFDATLERMSWYRSARATISTRGHAQICSIGNGTPTFALSTHPKVKGFMEHAGLLPWTFDVLTEDLALAPDRFHTFLRQDRRNRWCLRRLNKEYRSEIAIFNREVRDFVKAASS